jgi:hypothetical protein
MTLAALGMLVLLILSEKQILPLGWTWLLYDWHLFDLCHRVDFRQKTRGHGSKLPVAVLATAGSLVREDTARPAPGRYSPIRRHSSSGW